ncbi:MAG: nucleoside triphosphate pyrophosphohydrolase, partial [Clostridia bacterium]|nr:nucleoside triphosphate pyrophosphohydrolase [Clostridia bacterium]
MVEFEFKDKYSVDDLLKIMTVLRAPGGCPWDAEQNHKSIRSNFIEEVYEAIEAIDTDDSALLCEELGDVLLQVVFHTQMEKE